MTKIVARILKFLAASSSCLNILTWLLLMLYITEEQISIAFSGGVPFIGVPFHVLQRTGRLVSCRFSYRSWNERKRERIVVGRRIPGARQASSVALH